SVQVAVSAIRQAGATTQLILPGSDYTFAKTFISNGSAAAFANVTNPIGIFANLIFDVYKYLDSDNFDNHADCVTNINDAFGPLAIYLHTNVWRAFDTGTGSRNTDSCTTYLCQQIAFAPQNSSGECASVVSTKRRLIRLRSLPWLSR
ncbi:glycoside hydrolase family 5 protein, partial [Phanerochaete carnosa HHB-10118-sp]